MRADALRNRERIVAAALDTFTARGAEASMEEIARAAGLSVGALYRHFPDRQGLLEHIAIDALADLVAFARTAAADPVPARREVLFEVVGHCVSLPLALTKSLSVDTGSDPRLAALIAQSDAAFAELVRGAQREGGLRSDLTADEVIAVLNVGVCRPGARPGDPLLTVLLDGLAPPAGAGPSGGPAVSGSR
ncbi:TetR/AcrR family transcriptional regulator [Streptomyces sp. CA-111067]|uniref:TetR/AcrR family transcriptional regulator n=1 Tax=Streptomyces sp. CA-111067 TaxID=3240046 RepID=UPI003D970B49